MPFPAQKGFPTEIRLNIREEKEKLCAAPVDALIYFAVFLFQVERRGGELITDCNDKSKFSLLINHKCIL